MPRAQQSVNDIALSNCNVSPTDVEGGDTVTITWTATNNNSVATLKPEFQITAGGDIWQTVSGLNLQPGASITQEVDLTVQSRFGETQEISMSVIDVEIVGGF